MCKIFGRIALWLFKSVGFSNWIEILKILGPAAAFWIGLNQYRRSKAWKRLEFVAVEMKAFYADPATPAPSLASLQMYPGLLRGLTR